eukprot:Plantae.Rhodophyta-Purpureofilum_apyrenoidigerum.ctg17285.p1 GENE.Plantae.Rhodophyta-Purpureofilum_apyrenoidigerum.ctg17285~~Plantae.Rhodophyta-Purpureofilum_apyrenoidigerum.ctg17285.p1  ORF type:complete len:222 (+),score=27.86 Plantae.Rhodophyta-Purpureofilum_apyrenoidigerum.ctg17285:328-993(+)
MYIGCLGLLSSRTSRRRSVGGWVHLKRREFVRRAHGFDDGLPAQWEEETPTMWVDRDRSRYTTELSGEEHRGESLQISLRAEEAEAASAFQEVVARTADALINMLQNSPVVQTLLKMEEDEVQDHLSGVSGANSPFAMYLKLLVTAKRRAELVSALPEWIFVDNKSAEDGNISAESCVICIENYQEGENLKILPCLHVFHSHCADTWLQEHLNCPTCKFAL